MVAAVKIKEGLGALPLEENLARRLTDECLAMYYVDGSQRKPVKSNLLEYLNLKETPTNSVEYSSLVDMGMIWYLSTSTSDDQESIKRDGQKYHWHDYLEKMVSTIISRHPNAITIIFVNDRYDTPYSIKDEEHDRRAAKYIGAGNKFSKLNYLFPSPTEFHALFSDSGNKLRLHICL